MYRILQETGLSGDRASEAVGVMKELQQQSLDHSATKADLELLGARITERLSESQRDMTERISLYQRDMAEKLSIHQSDMSEKLSLHQTDVAEKLSRYHRNIIVWVVSTVATGVTLAVGLVSLAIRYL